MILVSGGTGMLGAYLLARVASTGEAIRALKRENSNLQQVKKIFEYHYNNNSNSIFEQIEWVNADLLDSESIYTAMQGVDTVYHCAAMISFKKEDKYRMIDNNVKGTANMVNAALSEGVKKFCHVSSIASLGSSENGEPITEETFRKPNSVYSAYSISKYRSEMEVWRGISEGLNAVIVNPSVILGAWDWKNGSSGIFTKVNQGLKFYTEGVTGYVDVNDVVNIMIKLTESNIVNQRFIVSAENLSFKEILFMIADALNKPKPSISAKKWMLQTAVLIETVKSKITGKEPLITKDSAKTAQTVSVYSNDKIRKTLNYEFNSIKDTVNRIAEQFKKENSI